MVFDFHSNGGVVRKKLIAIGALLSVLGVALVGANIAMLTYAAPHIHEELNDAPTSRVAIVLGARVYADGRPSIALQDRLQTALELYQTGKVQRILVSGDHGKNDYDEVNSMRRWLISHGVDSADVFMDHAGFRTYDTMRRAREVFEVDEAIICTQRYHLARSIGLARYAGIDAVGVVADRRIYPHAAGNQRREFLARPLAAIDILNPWSAPKHLGPKIPIDSDSALTHDYATR